MLPRRGLRWSAQSIGIGRRRIENASARSFSSVHVLRTTPRTSGPLKACVPGATTSIRSQFLRSNFVLPSAVGRRFASTTPTVGATGAATSDFQQPPVDLSYNSPVGDGLDSLLDAPETIGYLHSLGLEYGYGPTSAVEWLMEHIHVYAGTPWWASIALTAVAIRLALIKPYIDAADNATKLATVQPITAPMTTQMTELTRQGNTAAAMQLRSQVQLIHQRAGIKLWKSFVPMVQVFAGYGTFILLRGMANLPVPGLETGGMLWFQNLTVSDPYVLMPLMTAGILHLVLRKGGETGVSTMTPGILKGLSYGLPAITVIFTWWLPAGLQLSFLVSGALAAVQATLFRQPAFRQAVGMTPMPTKSNNPFDAKPEDSMPKSPYQPRVIVAQKDSFRPTYEAPRSASSDGKPNVYGTEFESAKGSGIIGGLKKKYNSAAEGARQTLQDSLVAAREKMDGKKVDGKRTKQELAAAAAYEKKRREEILLELAEMDERRRLEREERRKARGS